VHRPVDETLMVHLKETELGLLLVLRGHGHEFSFPVLGVSHALHLGLHTVNVLFGEFNAHLAELLPGHIVLFNAVSFFHFNLGG